MDKKDSTLKERQTACQEACRSAYIARFIDTIICDGFRYGDTGVDVVTYNATYGKNEAIRFTKNLLDWTSTVTFGRCIRTLLVSGFIYGRVSLDEDGALKFEYVGDANDANVCARWEDGENFFISYVESLIKPLNKLTAAENEWMINAIKHDAMTDVSRRFANKCQDDLMTASKIPSFYINYASYSEDDINRLKQSPEYKVYKLFIANIHEIMKKFMIDTFEVAKELKSDCVDGTPELEGRNISFPR